ncbi:hypothetical protein [Streptomyces roseicoloratus]|uniref:Uncharacterized protein n=1 Tax=Streptomyces roseicoloratus TaxID=2508722 RepID=A0ABY9RWJ8_9ACTN|nr:hypothetical protein [Streptomyces roseicoloratus]WMX46557.1 hypothetical protein RGF97_19315 [Streptomyces roseicoloratus]
MSTTSHECPGCGRDDLVQAVPAVYLGGRDSVTGRERNSDGNTRTVTRRVTTALSEALAPVPKEPSSAIGGLGFFAGFVCVAAFMGWVLVGGAFEDEPEIPDGVYGSFGGPPEPARLGSDLSFLGWVSGLALAVALAVIVILVRRRAAFLHRIRDRHRAEELWSQGWYCHRCGTVHLVGVPGEDTAPLTLQRFRERVWERGGYGDLAARRRVVD